MRAWCVPVWTTGVSFTQTAGTWFADSRAHESERRDVHVHPPAVAAVPPCHTRVVASTPPRATAASRLEGGARSRQAPAVPLLQHRRVPLRRRLPQPPRPAASPRRAAGGESPGVHPDQTTQTAEVSWCSLGWKDVNARTRPSTSGRAFPSAYIQVAAYCTHYNRASLAASMSACPQERNSQGSSPHHSPSPNPLPKLARPLAAVHTQTQYTSTVSPLQWNL